MRLLKYLYFYIISHGHAGYPFMTEWTNNHLPGVDAKGLADEWGNLHEIGHNMQIWGRGWHLSGMTDVTRYPHKWI